MKPLSNNLQFTLRDLVGTRLRFILLLTIQIAGFVLTILHLGLSIRQICDLAFWGLITPLLFLSTLRQVVVQFQRASGHEKPPA